LGLGTHGRPMQQSEVVEHPPPAGTQLTPVHRGTPTLSSLHVSRVWQLPLQQSHDELHDIVESLQTSPSGLHPIGFLQMPTAFGGVMSHVAGIVVDAFGKPAAPQQSMSCVQRSPTGWQPLAGWQTRTPVGPYGAQRRLQQLPPHTGTVPIKTAPSAHTAPSVSPQLAAPVGEPQTPAVAPVALVQIPPQHALSDVQMSPSWVQ
jgi:hypothetical protein